MATKSQSKEVQLKKRCVKFLLVILDELNTQMEGPVRAYRTLVIQYTDNPMLGLDVRLGLPREY